MLNDDPFLNSLLYIFVSLALITFILALVGFLLCSIIEFFSFLKELYGKKSKSC